MIESMMAITWTEIEKEREERLRVGGGRRQAGEQTDIYCQSKERTREKRGKLRCESVKCKNHQLREFNPIGIFF